MDTKSQTALPIQTAGGKREIKMFKDFAGTPFQIEEN